MAGYMSQDEIKPINAKKYCIEHWKEYDLVDTEEEFVELLNILQACGENLESLHDVVFNGETEYCDCINSNGWESDRDVVDMLFYFCSFYSVDEFIDLMIERHQDYKLEADTDDPNEEATERIRSETSDDPRDNNDIQITRTDDGYVIRIWC